MPKLNGYAKLLFDLKKQSGENLSMSDLQSIASEKWNKMNQEERAKYSKINLNKYNCIGQTIESQSRIIKDKRMKETKIMETIEEILQKASDKETNGVFSQVFYFFSTSYFARKREEDIFPAELAIAKFTLKHGIEDTMHMLINPGVLPLGYAAEAIFHANKSHRLDLPPNTEGEKSYKKIFETILDFVDAKQYTSEHVPPFFCFTDYEGDDLEAAELTMNKISTENDQNNAFRIFKAETLLFLLHKRVINNRNEFFGTEEIHLSSEITAWDALRRDDFRYSSIACRKHNDDDNSTNCCLSKVQRLCFSFVQYCLDKRFDKVAGKHFPINFGVASEENENEDDEFVNWDLPSKKSNLSMGITESFRNLSISQSSARLSKTISSESAFTMNSLPSKKSFRRVYKFNVIKPQVSDLSINQTSSHLSSQLSTSTNEFKLTPSFGQITFSKFMSNPDLDLSESNNTIKQFDELTINESCVSEKEKIIN